MIGKNFKKFDLKTISILVKIENNNESNELYRYLEQTILSYYANKLNFIEKKALLLSIYEKKDNIEFLKDLDRFNSYNKNLETLETIISILKLNL